MFPYEAQFKKVRDLSGGERARLALLLLSLGRYNLLVLDEPTNHLDLEMIEALEDALHAYEGTLLLVSHDRRFVSSLVDRVWEVDSGHFREYEGDWTFYWRCRRERAAADAAAISSPGAGSSSSAGAGSSAAAGGRVGRQQPAGVASETVSAGAATRGG